MTTMMSAEIKEVDNGFSLKLDGYIGDKDLVFSSIQEVLKEVSRYWDEHLATFNSEKDARMMVQEKDVVSEKKSE